MDKKYLMPTQESGRNFIMKQIQGSVVMLNLIRFREIADYSASPELKPSEPISGKQAYQRYIEHTLPFLTKSGGEILFMGEGGAFLIGPTDEQWDAVLLIKQNSVNSFLAFESNQEYMKGIGHRTAALEDSRLLPLVENKKNSGTMFTLEQIKTAHSKVKSGADFPSSIQEIKTLGVTAYEHFVSDGCIQYYGRNDFTISAEAKWKPMEVAAMGSTEKLKHSLIIHQQGQTDYPTFCKQSAEAGVEKWIVDITKMICTYYDKANNEMVVENVPVPVHRKLPT